MRLKAVIQYKHYTKNEDEPVVVTVEFICDSVGEMLDYITMAREKYIVDKCEVYIMNKDEVWVKEETIT